MTTRAAVLALAAPLLFTAPALADKGHAKTSKHVSGGITITTGNGSLSIGTGHISPYAYRSGTRYGYNTYGNRGYSNRGYSHRGYGNYHRNQYGQNSYEVGRLKQVAANACRADLRHEASKLGYRDIDFELGAKVNQIGSQGFTVFFPEVEFEARRFDVNRPITCTVRYSNNVTRLDGLPRPVGYGYNNGQGPKKDPFYDDSEYYKTRPGH